MTLMVRRHRGHHYLGLTDETTRLISVAGVDGQFGTDPTLAHARAKIGDKRRPRVGGRIVDVAAE